MVVRGDIEVLRRGIFGLRADEGLNAEALSADKALNKYSKKTQSLNPNGSNRNVVLPDATTLDLGWEIIIHNSGTANVLNVQDFGNNLLKEIRANPSGNDTKVYGFQLRDNSTQNGSWILKELGDAAEDADDVSYKIITSDAAVTTIASIPTKTDTIMQLEIKVVGRKESGTGLATIGDGCAFIRHVRVKNVGGLVSIHSLQSTYTAKDAPMSAWNLFVDILGTDVRVRVQGSINNIVNWEAVVYEQTI
ncbi:MAG: hypothetical protein QXL01_00380 [Thermoplasmatales archaeon]